MKMQSNGCASKRALIISVRLQSQIVILFVVVSSRVHLIFNSLPEAKPVPTEDEDLKAAEKDDEDGLVLLEVGSQEANELLSRLTTRTGFRTMSGNKAAPGPAELPGSELMGVGFDLKKGTQILVDLSFESL